MDIVGVTTLLSEGELGRKLEKDMLTYAETGAEIDFSPKPNQEAQINTVKILAHVFEDFIDTKKFKYIQQARMIIFCAKLAGEEVFEHEEFAHARRHAALSVITSASNTKGGLQKCLESDDFKVAMGYLLTKKTDKKDVNDAAKLLLELQKIIQLETAENPDIKNDLTAAGKASRRTVSDWLDTLGF